MLTLAFFLLLEVCSSFLPLSEESNSNGLTLEFNEGEKRKKSLSSTSVFFAGEKGKKEIVWDQSVSVWRRFVPDVSIDNNLIKKKDFVGLSQKAVGHRVAVDVDDVDDVDGAAARHPLVQTLPKLQFSKLCPMVEKKARRLCEQPQAQNLLPPNAIASFWA